MHITRWLPFVPAAALSAACMAGGGPPKAGGRAWGMDPLEQDVALAALEHQEHAERPVWVAGAVVCQPAPPPARPSGAQQARAARLLELGKGVAIVGNTHGAQDLLRQAAYLDGTSPAIAYHLARASEMAADTAMAVREYCRYLSLGASSAERAEVRERLLLLAPGRAVPAGQTPVLTATSRPPVRVAARRTAAQAGSARGRPVAAAGTRTAPSAPAAVAASPSVSAKDSVTYAGHADGAVVARGDGVDGAAGAATRPPPAPSREPERHTTRDAVIGAVVGAAAGAAVSRDVKGAILGGAAGGLLGAVIGRSAGGARRP